MRKFLISLAFILVLTVPAWAGNVDWVRCADTSVTDKAPDAGVPVCALLTDVGATGTQTASCLAVGPFKQWDIFYEPDYSGAGAAITCQIMACPFPTYSSAACHPVDGVTLNGSPPNDALLGGGGGYICPVCSGVLGATTPVIQFVGH